LNDTGDYYVLGVQYLYVEQGVFSFSFFYFLSSFAFILCPRRG